MYRLLDLFCGAGGAAVGYRKAGFEVHGIDNVQQSHYPYKFRVGDALEILADVEYIRTFDAVHTSPPCQAYSHVTPDKTLHTEMIAETRELLVATGLPYVIENVQGALPHMRKPVRLCGSSFGLRVQRHRFFEVTFPLVVPPCDHTWQQQDPLYRIYEGWDTKVHKRRWSGVVGVQGGGCGLGFGESEIWRDVMEIEHMTMKEMTQAIPPAYAEYIGNRLRRHLIDKERIPIE